MRERQLYALLTALAMTAGATDAISFLGLGGVFSSVMTANMVLLGLSAGTRNGQLALHVGAALAGYIFGTVTASRVTGSAGRRADGLSAPVLLVLIGEGIVLAVVTAGWGMAGAHPGGPGQVAMLAAAAVAMGGQSVVVSALGIPGISATYMTGMLTGILADLASPKRAAVGNRLLLLAALIAGAVASGVTYEQDPRLVPLILLAPLACAVAIAARLRRAGASEG